MEFSVHMTSQKCVDDIYKSLATLQGIRNIDISLERGTVIIETNLPYVLLQQKINNTGKEAILIKQPDLTAITTVGGLSGYSINNSIYGIIKFMDNPKGCIIDGTIDGLNPGVHGLHIHEFGDISNGCFSTGEHFNPTESLHGGPEDDLYKKHLGDLGNILADHTGRANFIKMATFLKISDIIGRSIVVTQNPDDFGKSNNLESKRNGNSGTRLACGIIAQSHPSFRNGTKICKCGNTLYGEKNQASAN